MGNDTGQYDFDFDKVVGICKKHGIEIYGGGDKCYGCYMDIEIINDTNL